MAGWIWEQFQAMDIEIKDQHLQQSQRKTNLSLLQKVKLQAKVKWTEAEEGNDPYSVRHPAIIRAHTLPEMQFKAEIKFYKARQKRKVIVKECYEQQETPALTRLCWTLQKP